MELEYEIRMESMGIYQYKKTETGIVILACRSLDDRAVIPETIGGEPVTQVAPYAFSQRRIDPGEETILWSGPDVSLMGEDQWEDLPLLCGERLKSIVLPETIYKIGNYAFYNCYYLEEFVCHSTLEDLGSGMFTGCNQMKQVGITIHSQKKSCMKELLSEIGQRIRLDYRSEEGDATLIFPEFFEEAVENTPARILYTTTHGAGHRYRYCFQDTKFQFKEYDSLFIHEVTRDTTAHALELALCRLFYPLHLSGQARISYVSYVTEHWREAAELVLEKKEMGPLKALVTGVWEAGNAMDEKNAPDRETDVHARKKKQLEILLELSGRNGFAEATSYLLEYMRTEFPPKRKDFTL